MNRVLTAAAGIPVVLGITYWGSDWLFASLIAFVSVMALDEFLDLRALRGVSRPGYWFLPVGGALTLSFLGPPVSVMGVLILGTGLLLPTALTSKSVSEALVRLADGVGGLIYTCMLLGFLILLPRFAVFVVLGIIWAGDVAAYYIGQAWGKHRLAPAISPKKTIEGSVAGAIASVSVGVGLGAALLETPYLGMVLISLTTALAGQGGDLWESAIKRSVGVKDSSARLPGHGGVLDRVDSLLFAAPVFYFLLLLV